MMFICYFAREIYVLQQFYKILFSVLCNLIIRKFVREIFEVYIWYINFHLKINLSPQENLARVT